MGSYKDMPLHEPQQRVGVVVTGDVLFSHGGDTGVVFGPMGAVAYKLELYPYEPGFFSWKSTGNRPIIGIGGRSEAAKRLVAEGVRVMVVKPRNDTIKEGTNEREEEEQPQPKAQQESLAAAG